MNVYDLSRRAVRYDLKNWGKPVKNEKEILLKYKELHKLLRATYIKWLEKEAQNV